MTLVNTLTIEAVSNSLFMDKGFSLSDRGKQERQVATSTSLPEQTRLYGLRDLYIKRLKAMIPYMETEAKTRAKATIKNLQQQQTGA